MRNMNKLEKEVLKEKLCSGCGTCIGICPKQCISMDENCVVESIDYNKCIECNLCYKCCPSVKVDFKKNSITSEKKNDKKIGAYISLFKGHAVDSNIRSNGASGGVVTGFFSYLLDYKIVDRVICADFKGEKATYRIVSKSDELKKHQRSYYIPVPMNLVIQEIKSNDLKYAVVGTPCQLQGLTQAAELFPKMKEKIIVKVGLFCGYVQKPDSIRALAKYMECEGDDWKFEGWRCGDYPGYTMFRNIKTDEEKKIIIYDAYSLSVPFHSLQKCFLCPDGTNEFSDFALGDVHGSGSDENIGIFRTRIGRELMLQAKKANYVFFSEENQEELYGVVKGVVTSKRMLVSEQIKLRKRKGKKVPEYQHLDLNSKDNIALRFFLRRKAKLYNWSLNSKIVKKLKNKRLIMRLGRYIYCYPHSSGIYRILLKIKKTLR